MFFCLFFCLGVRSTPWGKNGHQQIPIKLAHAPIKFQNMFRSSRSSTGPELTQSENLCPWYGGLSGQMPLGHMLLHILNCLPSTYVLRGLPIESQPKKTRVAFILLHADTLLIVLNNSLILCHNLCSHSLGCTEPLFDLKGSKCSERSECVRCRNMFNLLHK